MGVANISGNILTDSGASLSSYLPLTGGTLTGALNGTSATFSGNVKIGTGNTYYANQLVVAAGSEGGITIANTGTTGAQYLMFADGTTGADQYRGYITYNHSDNSLSFATDANIRLSLSSTGAATFSSSIAAASARFNTSIIIGNVSSLTGSWGNLTSVLQLGNSTTDKGYISVNEISGDDDINIVRYAYFDNTNWKRIGGGNPSRYSQRNAEHIFQYASSGADNSTITWNTALSLANNGAATFSSRVNVNNAPDDADIAMTIKAPSGGSKWILFGRDSSNIAVFKVSDTGAATFSSSVGIGAAPVFPLTLYGGTVSQGDAFTNMVAFDTTYGVNRGGGISFGGYFNTSSSEIYTYSYIQGFKENSTSGDFAGALKFGTRANGGTATERMRITSAGYVWINGSISGFSSSGVQMQVNGQTRLGGDILLHNGANVAQAVRLSCNGADSFYVQGALSKNSGSFRIDHPLESMTETHQLVHSFVEAPQADLYYRGKLTLVDGKGQANIDEVATMTEGTFEALCREVQCFTTNETGWDLVKGKVIGNIIYIESQNTNSTDKISWLVIGERKDKHMYDTDWTDENGKVIVEPLKEQAKVTALENK